MAKIIICMDGRPLVQGFTNREFHWSEPHGCYLYENRELELHEFNGKYAECMRRNNDLPVRVRVLISAETAAPVIDAPAIAAVPPTSLAPEPHQVTLDEAEAVFLRLAPHRLRAKTGPKVSAKAVEV